MDALESTDATMDDAVRFSQFKYLSSGKCHWEYMVGPMLPHVKLQKVYKSSVSKKPPAEISGHIIMAKAMRIDLLKK
eukprot:6287869-Amphidinium_carterae.2